MNPMQIILLVAYLFIGIKFLRKWKIICSKYINQSPEVRHMSTVALVIAGIFWIVVVPIAYLELLTKKIIQINSNTTGSNL